MITIMEELPRPGMRKLDLTLLGKKFMCPACGKVNSYFSYPGKTCTVCGQPFPAIEKMFEDLLQRKVYHFNKGETLMVNFLYGESGEVD